MFGKMAFHPKFFVNILLLISICSSLLFNSKIGKSDSSDESPYVVNNCFGHEINLLSALSTFKYSIMSQTPITRHEQNNRIYKRKNKNKFHIHNYGNRQFMIIVLLLCSDIEVNPGPLDVCPICLNIVTENHRAVQCDDCSKWYHAKCVDIYVGKYEFLSIQDDFNWIRRFCKILSSKTAQIQK